MVEQMTETVTKALCKVMRIYLKYPTISGKQKYGERVFSYEFYHQLRKKFNDIHLTVSGEPSKGRGLLPKKGKRFFLIL